MRVLWFALAASLAACAHAPAAPAEAPGVTAERKDAGHLANGELVEAVTLQNANGIAATVLTYGATLQSVVAPDRAGTLADVTLGFDDAESYETKPNYFGVTVGRYANRIANGQFELDGQTYQVAQNDGTNSLHGGTTGFDKRNWKILSVNSGVEASAVFALSSPDGDQGYPGKVDATVTYTLDASGALTIAFEATTDKPTVINMTNHALFNMAGDGAPGGTSGHILTIPASAYTPVDAILIPTGEIRPVEGSPFDFRTPRLVADGLRDGTDPQLVIGRGYDHNFALNKGLTPEPELAARLEDPVSGRVVEVMTTEPGVQLYTGNFLTGTVTGKQGHIYRMGDGIALEPQKFPDSPNQPDFLSARVDPGHPYRHVMVYRFSTAD